MIVVGMVVLVKVLAGQVYGVQSRVHLIHMEIHIYDSYFTMWTAHYRDLPIQVPAFSFSFFLSFSFLFLFLFLAETVDLQALKFTILASRRGHVTINATTTKSLSYIDMQNHEYACSLFTFIHRFEPSSEGQECT